MAYATTNPPALVAQRIGGGGAGQLWTYTSVDTLTVVDGAGYITDGYDLGMRAGGSVIVLDNDASPLAKTIHTIGAASATSVDLSDGVAIGSTIGD